MTLIQFLSLLMIALMTYCSFKANDWVNDLLTASHFSPKMDRINRKQKSREKKIGEKETEHRDRVQLNEGKDRLVIDNLMENATPITELVDDSHRVCARLMLAQQKQNIPKQQIPAELIEIIHQYSDYNEIRTLFHILTSPEDREKVFEFTSYVQMDRYLPSRADKVAHLRRRLGRGKLHDANKITFDDQDVFIQKLWFVSDVSDRFARAPNTFNWDAMGKLQHLEELMLGNLGTAISMEDIRKLPKSLKNLDILANMWTEPSGDVDLSLLPCGLEEFSATNCRGMNGILKFDAPNSNLVELLLRNTNLQPRLSSEANIPRSLKTLVPPLGFVNSPILQVMDEKDIKVIL